MVLTLPGFTQAQNQEEVDSLQKKVEGLEVSPERADALAALAQAYYRATPSFAIQIAQRAFEEAESLTYLAGQAEASRIMGMAYLGQGESLAALQQYDRALELYSLEHDSLGLGKVFNNFGSYFYSQGNLLTAKTYYEDALAYLWSQKTPLEIGKVYNNLGIVMRRQGNYTKSLAYYQKALEKQQQGNNPSTLAGLYNNLGVVYFHLQEYEQALSYYQRALAIKLELNEPTGIAQAYNNLGTLFLRQHDFENALAALEESLAIKSKLGDKLDEGHTLQNIGSLYLQQNLYGMAEQYLQTARELFENLDATSALATVDIDLVQIYLRTQRYALAQKTLNEAMVNLDQDQLFEAKIEGLQHQIELDSIHQDMGAAFQHIRELHELNSIYFNSNRAKEVARVQSLLEMDEQERENQQLREEKAKQAMQLEETQLWTQRLLNVNVTFLLGLVVLVGFVLILKRQQKKDTRYKKQLEQKNEEITTQAENLQKANDEITVINGLIEKKNRDITDSINYASQIQKALLPMNVTLEAYLPDHFIYYQPKDIVSGDFYWFHQVEGYLFLAVIDCTGHGVPGAFMSTLGQQALLNAVVQQGLREPAEILDALKVIIRQMLHQDRTQNQDGMDLSLMVINLKSKQLKFAGAKHSLLYCSEGHINEIKGDRMSVGGEQWTIEDHFSQYTLSLEKGMTFYMTTDGYKDQFGGPNNKKFLNKRFHKLILEVQALPMSEQHNKIKQAITQWMEQGAQEQVDDMLVWGIRWNR